jgi:hypothetical protein
MHVICYIYMRNTHTHNVMRYIYYAIHIRRKGSASWSQDLESHPLAPTRHPSSPSAPRSSQLAVTRDSQLAAACSALAARRLQPAASSQQPAASSQQQLGARRSRPLALGGLVWPWPLGFGLAIGAQSGLLRRKWGWRFHLLLPAFVSDCFAYIGPPIAESRSASTPDPRVACSNTAGD